MHRLGRGVALVVEEDRRLTGSFLRRGGFVSKRVGSSTVVVPCATVHRRIVFTRGMREHIEAPSV